jgi:hypothetical protein
MVAQGRVICPTCDNVVDLSFLGDATRADFDDDNDVGPFDPPTNATRVPTAPAAAAAAAAVDGDDVITARVKPKKPAPLPAPPPDAFAEWGEKTSPTVKRTRDSIDVKEVPVAPPPGADDGPAAFLIEATQADFDDLGSLLKSSTDALVLGDPSDIVESLWVEDTLTRPFDADAPPPSSTPASAGNENFLTDATSDGTRDVVPVQVYVGGDIARIIEPDAVLERVPGKSAPLSTFEEFVLAQIDGARPVARVQTRMGLGAGDLRIALALLVDKKLVRRVGRAAPVTAAPSPAPAKKAGSSSSSSSSSSSMPEPAAKKAKPTPAPAPASSSTPEPEPPARTNPITSVPRPPARHVAGPAPLPPEPEPLPEDALVPLEAPADPALELDDGRTFPARPLTPLPGAGVLIHSDPTDLAARPAVTTSMHDLQTMQMPAAPSLPPQLSKLGVPTPAPPPPVAQGLPGARTGLVVDDAGRSRAAALHAQVLRDLKNGAIARAYAVARMAHDAAPDVPLYREILDNWNAFVAEHRTADDARLHAQAVSAESSGDPVRAVALLRQAVQANPQNAAAWNRLGLLLATRIKDVDGALNAMTRAIELSPNDPTFKNNFGKIAAMADRGGPEPDDKKSGGLLKRIFRR